MTAAALSRDPGNALTALSDLARSLPAAALVTIEAAGFAISLALYAWAPRYVVLALPSLAASALGLWGVTAHAIAASYGHRNKTRRRILRAFQLVIALMGCASLLVGGFALIGWMMGVYVS